MNIFARYKKEINLSATLKKNRACHTFKKFMFKKKKANEYFKRNFLLSMESNPYSKSYRTLNRTKTKFQTEIWQTSIKSLKTFSRDERLIAHKQFSNADEKM